MLLSFTIPCYRSEKTLRNVVEEIIRTVRQRPEMDYEIVLVNDASPDGVWQVIRDLAAGDPKIKGVDLARNGGKHAALMAAYAFVTGDVVIGVDDDGQCPLDHLWELLAPLDEGYDMAMARYPVKKQSGLKNFGSKVNDWMVRFLIGKPRGLVFSNFIARRRFVVEEIAKYRNPYPYLEGLTLRTTHNIAMVPMEERARQAGVSGYTLRKSLALWVNGCTSFSVKPLRLATVLGLICAALGFLLGMGMVIAKLAGAAVAAGYTSIMALMLFLGGMIMVMLGIIGEYVGRIFICINQSPQYVVREKLNA